MSFIPNPLSEFEQYSYHISFSMSKQIEGSIAKQPASPGSLIIAETGKQAQYYVEELSLETITPSVGEATITNITTGLLTIIEPQGFTLFDRMVAGMIQQGWKNFGDTVYHLDISFNGWTPAGTPLSRTIRQQYRVKVANISTESDQMKTTYRFDLRAFEPVVMAEESISPKRQFRSEIKQTLQETIKEFERIFNKTAQGIQNSTRYNVGIADRYQFNIGPNLAQLNLKMPIEVQSDTSVNQKDGDGKLFYNYGGERIDEALMKIVSNAKDIAKTMIPNLTSEGHIDFTKPPEPRLLKFFTCAVDLSYGPFNTELNRYQRIYEYTIDIVPRPDLTQLAPNASPALQRALSLVNEGLLRKRYDHYFTGKNTEVIEAKIDFNTSYTAYQGAYNNIPAEYGHSITEEGRQNEIGLGPFRKGPLGQLISIFNSLFSSLGFVKNITGFNSNLLETLPLSNAMNGFITQFVKPVQSPEQLVSGMNTIKSPYDIAQVGSITYYYSKMTNPFQPLVEIKLVVRGDPYWIDRNVGGVSQYTQGTQYFYYYSRTTEPANEMTGLSFNFGKINFEGIYSIPHVKSTFAGGKFTQEITGILDTETVGVSIPP